MLARQVRQGLLKGTFVPVGKLDGGMRITCPTHCLSVHCTCRKSPHSVRNCLHLELPAEGAMLMPKETCVLKVDRKVINAFFMPRTRVTLALHC